MVRLTLKELWAHKLRYALTGLAVVLGVAFMAGTMVLTDTMRVAFDRVVASTTAGTDVVVRRAGAIDSNLGTVRARVDAELVDRIAAVDGVRAAAGSIQGMTQLVRADGTVPTMTGLSVTIGANWIDDPSLNPLSLVEGRAPRSGDEAVLDRRSADDEGFAVGDEVTVLTEAGPHTFTLVGTAAYGDQGGVPGATVVATDTATAQRLFAEPGRVDAVVAAGEEGVSPSALRGRLEDALGGPDAGLEVLTGADDTAERQADLREDLRFFDQFLLAFAYVALFVGSFIIFNTFSIVVAQRARELALLRAIGAQRSQITRAVVLEALVVGVVAAAIGLVAGIGLSYGLRAMLGAAGLDIPDAGMVLSSGTVVTSLAVGLVISVVAAVVPARRAGRLEPMAALRASAAEAPRIGRGRVAAGLAMVAAGGVTAVSGVVRGGGPGLRVLGAGTLAVLLGGLVLGPAIVRPVLAVLGAPARGVTGRYARGNAARNPRRTSATAAALTIGVGLVGFITIVAASTRASVGDLVDRSFRADLVVESGSWNQGFAVSVEDDLAALPEVAALSPMRRAAVEVDVTGTGRPGGTTGTDVVAVDTAAIDRLYDLDVTAGALADVRGDGVAVARDTAGDDGLAVGSPVTFRFAGGPPVTLVVRAVYDELLLGGSADGWLVGLDTFTAHVPDQFDQRVFVALADGVRAAEGLAAVEDAVAAWPNAEVQDHAAFKEAITDEIDQLLNLVYGLLALAVVIALIGIANTLALSVHERTRELGVLRAIGMLRRQVRAAVRWEALLIALLGASVGVLLALGGAWAIVATLRDQGVTRFAVPGPALAAIVAAAGLAGVLAATGPARRAARLDVLQAIATE